MSIGLRVAYVRRAMNVRRYHQHTTHEIDTVGKHSCGVALFAQLIHPGCSKEVLLAALVHDLGEFVTGDIPAPAKRVMTETARNALDDLEVKAIRDAGFPTDLLTDDEQRLLKICDYCDGLSFVIEEIRRGNRSLVDVGENYIAYLPEYIDRINPGSSWYVNARMLIDYLVSEWRKVHVQG